MRVVFFGTPEFAVPSLRALIESPHGVVAVVAQPDRPAGRGMQVQSPPVADVARQHNIELLQPLKIREEGFLEKVLALQPDLGVVIAYGKILPPALLKIPRHGFINVHASLLPKYRGAAPIQRAIANGEGETGVTIMRVDEELDHGPILSTAPTPIGAEERASSVSKRLAGLGAARLVEVVSNLERGQVEEIEQDHASATYAAKIEKDEGRVDWSACAIEIFNRFRAFDPWPGLFASFRGENVKLLDVTPTTGPGQPGSVLDVSSDAVEIATGEGALRILTVQRPGKRPVSGGEFARTARLRSGSRLA